MYKKLFLVVKNHFSENQGRFIYFALGFGKFVR